MNGWVSFWSITFITVVIAYYLVAVIILPLGLRDLSRLLVRLNQSAFQEDPEGHGPDSSDENMDEV